MAMALEFLGISPDRACAASRRPTRARTTSRDAAGQLVDGSCCAPRHHRQASSPARRSRTRSPPSPRPAARRTPCCTCSRSRARRASTSNIDDFDAISARTPMLCRPQARRPLRRHRPARGRRASRCRRSASTRPGSCTGTRRPSPAARWPRSPTTRWRPPGQEVVRPLADPLKPTGGLAILRGNLAPEGCVVKLAGHERPSTAARRASSSREEDAFAAVRPARSRPATSS